MKPSYSIVEILNELYIDNLNILMNQSHELLEKNTEFNLENENFKPDFKLIWQESEENLHKNLQSLRARLLD